MSAMQCLRKVIDERAAAEEIFAFFEETIVKYEDEIDHQRKLLDNVWKADIKPQMIELCQQHICEEEEVVEVVLSEQQLCNQQRDSSLDLEDPEPPQIKEELCTSQREKEHELKQDVDNFIFIPNYEESEQCEPEPNSDQQLLSHVSHVAKDVTCGEAFRLNSELTILTGKAHTGEKLYHCTTCGKRYFDVSQLERHIRSHTDK